MALCVPEVHPDELSTEEFSFITAGSRTEFHDDVFVIRGVFRKEEEFKLFLDQRDTRLEIFKLILRHVAHIGIGEEIFRILDALLDALELTKCLDKRRQTGVLLGSISEFIRIHGDRRVHHHGCKFIVASADFQQFLMHNPTLYPLALREMQQRIRGIVS